MHSSHRVYGAAVATLASLVTIAACSKRDASSAADTAATSAAPATPAPAPAAAAPATSDTLVRGTVASVTDTVLTIRAADGGQVRVALASPVTVFAREKADLSRVTERSFVGVTSVAQPDGSQRATEIHIFPEALRGLGEGSRPMGAASGTGGRTMTNGTVAAGASRMTNGAVRAQSGGTLSVEYNGGSQTITVPPNVTVTALAPTTAPLRAGANVVVLATRRADGSLQSSRVLLAAPTPAR
ncbi:hypothetical protein J421_4038 [Gemmatirosa kalamazoonensis]|uniref:DUF5666 domain-containing protein n=1 Tax=Gemmatirosa kalamazoonensis TaxID=861299 RepID=W0RMM1_9BACT|nr:hypothetical protein [Gemmatirosa kalamazoonensis]AHG91575.1 hypothetical protein J421_4038 [Gemmatirosa kalamazoonensis]